MYVTNLFEFGHLVNSESFDITLKHPDFYMLLDNRWDWEQRYIHSDYASSLDPNTIPAQVPDIFSN